MADVQKTTDCPVCGGDCSSANPPMGDACPMRGDREHLLALVKVEREAANRERRHGANLLKTAREQGWADDGDGPLEFLIRLAYETGYDDARRVANGTR